MNQKKFKDKQVGMFIRVDPSIKELVEQRSKETNESVNSILNDLIIREFQPADNYNQSSSFDRTVK